MYRQLMYDVKDEWTKKFWCGEFCAEQQGNIIERFLNKMEIQYIDVHNKYYSCIDFKQIPSPSLAPIEMIKHLCEDAMCLMDIDLAVGLYSYSCDQAFTIGVLATSGAWIPFEDMEIDYQKFNYFCDNKESPSIEEITIVGKKYNILTMRDDEIIKDAFKRAIHEIIYGNTNYKK